LTKVLIFTQDLFINLHNGVSRYYQIIVEKNPDVQFYYFAKYKNVYDNHNVKKINYFGDSFDMQQMLASISYEKFDIIEFLDSNVYPLRIKDLLHKYSVGYNKIFVSLHGNSSSVLKWTKKYVYNFSPNIELVRKHEKAIYKIADKFVYISPSYAKQINRDKNKSILIDFRNFVDKPSGDSCECIDDQGIILTSVGRQNSTKGIQDFIWLEQNSKFKNQKFEYFGSESEMYLEKQYITNITSNSKIVQKVLARSELNKIYTCTHRIFVLPSFFDSFNLALAEILNNKGQVVASSGVLGTSQLRSNSLYIYKFSSITYFRRLRLVKAIEKAMQENLNRKDSKIETVVNKYVEMNKIYHE
jgi:hypothetical protein